MNKIILSLLFVLIALTGIACASACDVDNITVDDNAVMIDQDVDEVPDVDLNQDIDDNATSQDEDNSTPMTEDNVTDFDDIKAPVSFSTIISQKENVLFYTLDLNLNCTGDLSFTVKSGNKTCLDCALTLNGPNSFTLKKLSNHAVNILPNDAVTYTITVCYEGNENYAPTMLSQIIVVDSSIINRFVVSIDNAISTTLMCVNE